MRSLNFAEMDAQNVVWVLSEAIWVSAQTSSQGAASLSS